MRVLVTGATGFIGSHLVRRLRELDWSVVCVTRSPLSFDDPDVVCINGDLKRPESLEVLKEKVGPVDAVFHLAALLPTSGCAHEIYDFLKVNVIGTAALLNYFREWEPCVFVYASSLPVIGKPEILPITEEHPTKPTHPYHVSKLAAELLCEQTRMSESRKVVSLRITSAYGPGMPDSSVLPRFIELALASEDIKLYGSGSRTQNFVHVSDIVRACILAARGKASGVFNIGGTHSISMRELAQRIITMISGCSSQLVYLDTPDPQENYRWELDLKTSRQKLGYEPQVSLDHGLGEFIALKQTGRTKTGGGI